MKDISNLEPVVVYKTLATFNRNIVKNWTFSSIVIPIARFSSHFTKQNITINYFICLNIKML